MLLAVRLEVQIQVPQSVRLIASSGAAESKAVSSTKFSGGHAHTVASVGADTALLTFFFEGVFALHIS